MARRLVVIWAGGSGHVHGQGPAARRAQALAGHAAWSQYGFVLKTNMYYFHTQGGKSYFGYGRKIMLDPLGWSTNVPNSAFTSGLFHKTLLQKEWEWDICDTYRSILSIIFIMLHNKQGIAFLNFMNWNLMKVLGKGEVDLARSYERINIHVRLVRLDLIRMKMYHFRVL